MAPLDLDLLYEFPVRIVHSDVSFLGYRILRDSHICLPLISDVNFNHLPWAFSDFSSMQELFCTLQLKGTSGEILKNHVNNLLIKMFSYM